MIHFSSWPGFVPAIHVFLAQVKLRQDVDARHRRQVYTVCAKQTAMAGHGEIRLIAPFADRRSVRHRADILRAELYLSPAMTHYTFRIRQGAHSSDVAVDLPDDGAAWDEAAMACSDMIRDTIARLGDSPEWRLEVADGSGALRHLFRLTAESFK